MRDERRLLAQASVVLPGDNVRCSTCLPPPSFTASGARSTATSKEKSGKKYPGVSSLGRTPTPANDFKDPYAGVQVSSSTLPQIHLLAYQARFLIYLYIIETWFMYPGDTCGFSPRHRCKVSTKNHGLKKSSTTNIQLLSCSLEQINWQSTSSGDLPRNT